MTAYDIYNVAKDHELLSVSSLLVILLVASKLISVSKVNLDPWGFILSLPGRIGKSLTADLYREVTGIKRAVEDLDTSYKSDRKKTLRRSILRFSDECRIGQRHSKEMFDTVLMEITEYEELCKDTSDPNHVIAEAIQFITELNHKCHIENDYL